MIPLFKVYMSKNAKAEVSKVLDSGFIGQGAKVDEFEKELEKNLWSGTVVTTNSGTAAEHLAFRLLKQPDVNQKQFDGVAFWDSKWPGIQPGDEALCTALTCTATNWPVLANGLKIKWVDIDPKNLNMDLDDLERKLSPTTKVIYVVHWGGNPIDLTRLQKIQEKAERLYGFKPAIIEDCAHAFGAKFNGKPIGSHGNLCTFSFQAIKHMTSGDGGMLICPHEKLYKRARLLRWYGIDRDGDRKDFRCEADIPEWGFKFHMNDVCATVGNENLNHANTIISQHRENAAYYDLRLQNIPGVTLLDRQKGFDSAFWIYSLLVDDREGFYEYMDECGISVSQVHERNDKHTCVEEFKTELPNLDKTIGKIVNIPVGWWVTNEQREHIVECIRRGW